MASQGAGQDGPGEGGLTVAQLEVFLRDLEHLPARAAVIAAVLEETRQTNDGDQAARLARITELVESDPATAAKVVSAAIGGSAPPVRTVAGAVDRLGAEGVRSVLPALRAAPSQSSDHQSLWLHCLAVALAADMLADPLGLDRSQAWLCGLLHDLGKAALLHLLPKSYLRVVDVARDEGIRSLEAERRVIGIDHALTGRRVAERWKLPQAVCESAWLHHQPVEALPASIADRRMVAAVRICDAIAHRRGLGFPPDAPAGPLPTADAAQLGLSEKDTEAVEDGLAERLARRIERLSLEPADEDRRLDEALVGAGAELGRINDQLRRSAGDLAVPARAFEHVRELAGDLTSDVTVEELLARVASVFASAGEVDASAAPPETVVAYSTCSPEEGLSAARWRRGQGVSWRMFTCAGEPREEAPPAGRVIVREAFALPAGDEEQFLDWCGMDEADHYPLRCGGRWVGGVLVEAGAADNGGVCAALGGAVGPILSLIHDRCRAVRLSEQLAGASQVLAEMQEALTEAKALAAVGDLAAGAAHEINNPLAVVSGRAQIMRERAASEEHREAWRTIADQAQRISDLITRLMEFASPPRPARAPVDVSVLLADAVADFRRSKHPQAASATVDIQAGDEVPDAHVDAGQIRSVVSELIANAATACGPHGAIRLAAGVNELDKVIVITVEDNGPGIDQQTLSRVFTPFFSSQDAGRKSGLGLPRARRYVESNGGSISIHSFPGEGTTVRVRLPAAGSRKANREDIDV